MGKPGRPSSPPPPARTPTQLAVIKIGEGEMRGVQAKKETGRKGDEMCGHMKPTGDDTSLLGDVGEEHADAFFEMYINAEAWGGN
jgi:hypothetical protein